MTVYEQMNLTIDHILENEALTDDLDDQAAKRLLSWGIQLIGNIRGDEDEDDEEALLDTSDDARIFEGLATIPKLLKLLNRWLSKETKDEAANRAKLAEVVEKMQIIRGKHFRNPVPDQQEAFLKQLSTTAMNPEEKIKGIIQLF